MKERSFLHNGVPIDNLPPAEALSSIHTMLETNTRGNHLVTLGIAKYLEARQDGSYNQILNDAVLVVPESSGLSLYSKIVAPQLINTPGGDLARAAVSVCRELDQKVVLIGSSHENRVAAQETLKSEEPNLNVEIIPGEYDFNNITDAQEVVEQLDIMHPALTIMAGTEVEAERWIDQWIIKNQISTKVVGNFGQTIDVWAGNRFVPPDIARNNGLGWLLRIPMESQERRNRYIRVLSSFGKMALQDFVLNRKSGSVLDPQTNK